MRKIQVYQNFNIEAFPNVRDKRWQRWKISEPVLILGYSMGNKLQGNIQTKT